MRSSALSRTWQPTRFRLLAALLATSLALLAGCGGDDSEAGETSADCVDRFVELVSSDEVAAAARAGGAPSPQLTAALEAIDDDCAAVFEGPEGARHLEALEELDPVVLDWLSEPAPAPFEQTGDSIAGP